MRLLLITFILYICAAKAADNSKPRFLSQPVPSKCSARPKKFTYNGHNYFYSGQVPEYANQRVDWLEARNICREYCMDAVSLETEPEYELIAKLIRTNNVPYIWTSGRLCDFNGCEGRSDLLPLEQKGWFWSATRVKLAPTNEVPRGFSDNPWSRTGHKKEPQPDNAEYDINKTPESCMAVLNDVYSDGIQWHDVACYHEKPFVCEDSDELLKYVAATNPGIKL